jgi:hypothetical protein
VQLFETQRRADLVFEAADGAALDARSLEEFELAADLLDPFARPAEIDRMLAAVFAVGEAIVRTELLAVATAPGGGYVTLAGKQLGARGQEAEGRMSELVSRRRDFHFLGAFIG